MSLLLIPAYISQASTERTWSQPWSPPKLNIFQQHSLYIHSLPEYQTTFQEHNIRSLRPVHFLLLLRIFQQHRVGMSRCLLPRQRLNTCQHGRAHKLQTLENPCRSPLHMAHMDHLQAQKIRQGNRKNKRPPCCLSKMDTMCTIRFLKTPCICLPHIVCTYLAILSYLPDSRWSNHQQNRSPQAMWFPADNTRMLRPSWLLPQLKTCLHCISGRCQKRLPPMQKNTFQKRRGHRTQSLPRSAPSSFRGNSLRSHLLKLLQVQLRIFLRSTARMSPPSYRQRSQSICLGHRAGSWSMT